MGRPTLRLRWIAALAVAAAGAASPAQAATPDSDTLDDRREAVLWTGQVTRAQAPSNAVPECSLTACDEFELRLDLPSGTFNKRPGGVEVAMRWFGTFGDNLRLYVYSEARCARLAATGRTNREIAQDLFVSLRAVEMHLSSAYRKLGIRSRRELGSLADLADGADLGAAEG